MSVGADHKLVDTGDTLEVFLILETQPLQELLVAGFICDIALLILLAALDQYLDAAWVAMLFAVGFATVAIYV